MIDGRIVERKLAILNQRLVVESKTLGPWEFRLAEYHAPGNYEYAGDWVPLPPGMGFPALKTVFLKTTVEIPGESDAWRLDAGHSGLEALLFVDGVEFIGIDANHTRLPVPAPGIHEFLIEGVAHLRALCAPELRGKEAEFSGMRLVRIDPVLEGFLLDFSLLREACENCQAGRRKGRLEAILDEAALAFDPTDPLEALREQCAAGRQIIADGLAAIAPDPEAGKVFLCGHTHIDTAWLWPVAETVRKCGRSFATAVRLMETYPDFHFSCSQAQLYAYTKEYYPALYADIKKWVAAGRWHTTGAMWVETDCNVPSGESLIRQILVGLEFFREEFGTRPRTCWLPDVFGYPGNLPQLLKGCGLDYFMTCKLHWQSLNPMPTHLFHWRGVDGSSILAHIPRLKNYYNGQPNPDQLRFAWDHFKEQSIHDEVLLPFGFGDGGGGVTPTMLERTQRLSNYPGLPQTSIGGEEEFFARAARNPDLPSWDGELYLETHRGTYTSQSRTKQLNRQAELALREAELWAVVAQASGHPVDTSPLKQAWRKTLLQQFHDILPGSSIPQVYVDADNDYRDAIATAKNISAAARNALLGKTGADTGITLFNPLSWSRSLIGCLDHDSADVHLEDGAGKTIPVQADATGSLHFESGDIPAFGWRGFRVLPGAAGKVDDAPQAGDNFLENAFFRLEFNDCGGITRLLDKRENREVVPAGECANDWQFFQDGPEREAAWNVHACFEKKRYPTAPAESISAESGPVYAALTFHHRFRNSSFTCKVILYRNTPRIDFNCTADWHERHVMLKTAFPVNVRSSHATCGVQFGAIERSTTRNHSWETQKFEVAAERWADLSESGYGVSLIAAERNGYDIKGNQLRLTLLRSPDYPDPKADAGKHHFRYCLFPHQGSWSEAETARQTIAFGQPATVHHGTLGNGNSAFAVSGQGVIIETIKPAADGDGIILRLYESNGGRGTATVRSAFPLATVCACNLVEENGEDIAHDDNQFIFAAEPFRIRTFRLRLQKQLS